MDIRKQERIQEIYNRNSDMVYRICYLYLKNEQDAYDVTHETFIRLILREPEFPSREAERAWLIRVAVNCCRDMLKSWWRSNWNGREAMEDQRLPRQETEKMQHSQVLEAVLTLPLKYRTLIYLHYYEGYTIAEIGEILDQNPSTLRGRISRARELLRKELGEDVS